MEPVILLHFIGNYSLFDVVVGYAGVGTDMASATRTGSTRCNPSRIGTYLLPTICILDVFCAYLIRPMEIAYHIYCQRCGDDSQGVIGSGCIAG